jgi:hypothetical protein
MAFVCITWMNLPFLCHAYVSFSFVCPLAFYHQHNRSPQQKAQKNHPPSIPSCRIFTICRVIASRRTCFLCLFVCLFVPLVGCRVISLPLVVVSHPVLLPCHVVTLHRISCHPSHCCRVIASLHRCTVTSLHSRVVASLLHHVIASSCRCIIVSSHHHVVASLHRRIVASRLASSLY